MNQEPARWLDRFVGACLTTLVGAAAISIAVHLIEAVWTSLVIIVGVGAFIASAAWFLHSRWRRW